jgi:3-oxoacyl-[acyl-carrier-protein] synthase-3
VDLIILATATPDQTFPASATKVQAMHSACNDCIAFDVAAVCSGFLYARVAWPIRCSAPARRTRRW